jgi:hypothetical protein
MKAKHYQELFAGRLKGDLTPAEDELLDRHLESCGACRQEFAGTQQLWADMGMIHVPASSPMLRADFDRMLSNYQQQTGQKTGWKTRITDLLQWRPQISFMWQLVIVMFSFAGGYLLFNAGKSEQKQQLTELSGQVHELKQTMMLAMLENSSASERIKAVSFTSEIKHADSKVITALLSTLNNDPNVNVRLSTLDALLKMAKKPEVREGLVQSITQQDSPMMQLAIAEAMLKLQETRSLKPLRQLLKQKNLDQLVRSKIKETINGLI